MLGWLACVIFEISGKQWRDTDVQKQGLKITIFLLEGEMSVHA